MTRLDGAIRWRIVNPNSNGRVCPYLRWNVWRLICASSSIWNSPAWIRSLRPKSNARRGSMRLSFAKICRSFIPRSVSLGSRASATTFSELKRRIARILKIDNEQRIVLVGAGNLGSALVGYPGLKEHHFNLVAVFDNNTAKIGQSLFGDLTIHNVRSDSRGERGAAGADRDPGRSCVLRAACRGSSGRSGDPGHPELCAGAAAGA